MVFGVIWGVFFFYSVLEYNISHIVVQWYFNRERDKKGSMKGSMGRSVVGGIKHMGTLCVTSFITSLFVFIRFVFEYVVKRLEQANKIGNSKAIKAAIWFGRCCLACIQKIVQWINRNVQVFACISGEGYCKSMKEAIKLMMAKIFSNVFYKLLTTFFLFLGKIMVTAVAGFVTMLIGYYKADHAILFAPSIIASGVAYLISYYVIEVIVLVVDTIYMCYLYEETFLAT